MSNRNNPLVTTVITTFQRPDCLKRAVRSALNQTMRDIRVCVYDDVSSDKTGDVMRETMRGDSRLFYHVHPENIGAPKNFDYGIRHVETPFFSILADDDLLLPNFYASALREFERYPEAMVVIGDTLYLGRNNEPFGRSTLPFRPGSYSQPEGLLAMSVHPQPAWTGMLFRREVLERVGSLDTDLFSMDYDFVLRVAAECPYVITHEPVAVGIVHGGQSTAVLRLHMVWPTRYAAVQKVAGKDSLDRATREKAVSILTEDFGRLVFMIGLRALTLEKPDECLTAAGILGDVLHMRGRQILLVAAERANRASSAPRFALTAIHKIRRSWLAYSARKQMAGVLDLANLSELNQIPSG